MELATICLGSLVLVVLVSCFAEVNVGLVAIAITWLIGTWVAPQFGQSFTAREITGWFPTDLFVTLAGVTCLFALAQQNGSLDLVTRLALRVVGRLPAAVPVAYFLLAFGLSAAGAGNVATVALVASSAMATATRLGIAPIVMTIMVGHGSIAGTLSPVSPMGIIAQQKMSAMGLEQTAAYTFGANLLTNVAVAVLGYCWFRGWRCEPPSNDLSHEQRPEAATPATVAQVLTLGHLALLLAGVLGWQLPVGLAAITAAVSLILLRAADDRRAVGAMPWNVMLMVCGVSVLVSLCEQTGGLKLLAAWLASVSTRDSLAGWMAGVTGLISVFSSTSGVVLPTFLPTVPEVLVQVDGTATPERLLAVSTAVNVGSNLVDISSVSTIGALCVAATPAEAARRRLFRQALLWGLAMAAAAAMGGWIFLGSTP